VLFGALYGYHVLFSSPYFMPLHLSSAQFTQLLVIEQPARYSLRFPKCLLHNSCKSYEQAEIMKTTDNVYRIDLAGTQYQNPRYLQSRARINSLIDHYMSLEVLSDRLSDLPQQFSTPQPRPWEPIDWQGINRDQIIGVKPEIFLQILASAAEIEAPIRSYGRESWCYLQHIYPQMARFMGGIFDDNGNILEIGVWEKEERQHCPTFRKIYQQLTAEKLQVKPNSVNGCQSTGDAWQDTYKHVISRLSTEWGATSVYLWLMVHSTGALQQAISQPLQDEINHLAKFWGFSRWAFSQSYFNQLKGSTKNLIALLKHHQIERTHGNDVFNTSLSLKQLSLVVELTFTFTRVMVRLRRWNRELSRSYLRHLFGTAPMVDAPRKVA